MPTPLWHPYTPSPPLGPRVNFVCAQGAYVYDDSGKKYLDLTSSWWCQIHGHCHPRLVAALNRQAEILDHVMMAPHTHPVAESCARQLIDFSGFGFAKVFFSDNGSTAVETALKMAMQFWKNRGFKKNSFIHLDRAYHGDTLGAVSIGQIEEYHSMYSHLRGNNISAQTPYCLRCPVGKDRSTCQIECLDSLETHLDKKHAHVAALIIEPLVLGAAGMIVYPKAYLEKIVRMCRQREILVIFDEVFTGFGRTGSFFAYQQLAQDCVPDIFCLSKGLTSGMLALGATVTSQRIFEAFEGGGERTFFHGHTFAGNALSCAVALESLQLFEEEKVLERNAEKIAIFSSETERFEALPMVHEVRHLGMIWNVELKTIGNAVGWKIAEQLWADGFWIRPLHNNIYLVPPFCITNEELKGALHALHEAIRGVHPSISECQSVRTTRYRRFEPK